MYKDETIAAISTGTGSGIGVIRVSGERAIEITEKVFRGRKNPSEMKGYQGTLGMVFDREGDIDEAVLFVFRAPHSYTGENVCEISCHGGAYILQKTLDALLEAGAVPAGPGEFTKRAFLNGKMSLTEAESVMQLINGENRQSIRAALSQKEGAIQNKIFGITDLLMTQAAHITAYIDYPEEGVEEILIGDIAEAVNSAMDSLTELINNFDKGRLLREGISTAIVGSPNVGKSTLMNLLAGYERSIVTDIAGTTRDVIEERIRMGDFTLNLSDTAGIHNTADVVEKIGVERSISKIMQCDLILAVFDSSRPLSESDKNLLSRLTDKLAVGIMNKSDLPAAADADFIKAHTAAVVSISAKDGTGIEELKHTIEDILGLAGLSENTVILANRRQLSCAVSALKSLEETLNVLNMGETLDIISMSLEEAIDSLLELSGKKAAPEVIDRVFETFCVGK